MKRYKILVLFFIMIITLFNNIKGNVYANINLSTNSRNITNIGVSIFNFNDPYLALVKQSLEDIEKKNANSIHFTFLDGKDNQSIQNETIDNLLNKNYDLLLLNLVDLTENTVNDVINKVISKNKPVVLFNTEPVTIPSILKAYDKVVIVSTNVKQSGTLQGKILVNEWNKNKSSIDKNNNNILEYIMLQGKSSSSSAIERTKYSISTINDAGIKTKQLASEVCNWNQDCAKISTQNLFLRFGDKIEAIIANNDAMAIGAIKALQEYGYNTGDKSKYIPVVGIDAIPEAKELVNKGIMTGTVFQDPTELAQAIYTVGMNLVNNKPPLEGTNYSFNASGITIDMPYYEYT